MRHASAFEAACLVAGAVVAGPAILHERPWSTDKVAIGIPGIGAVDSFCVAGTLAGLLVLVFSFRHHLHGSRSSPSSGSG